MVDDAREMLLALQDEIRRSEEARYDHRLHGVLLVAQGMNAPKVARLLGDGVRTVEYWVERFNQDGFRKPRPMIGHADPELQSRHKKTPGAGSRHQR